MGAAPPSKPLEPGTHSLTVVTLAQDQNKSLPEGYVHLYAGLIESHYDRNSLYSL